MGWKQGCILEIVSSPLPLAEGFFGSPNMKRICCFYRVSGISNYCSLS
ncbi:hypothetical protein SynA1562_01607 [Synechococcus sp. A15-62]|nr:hypothetical protein SynA1562_01607 [Synechococcus sp. A15-62]